MSDSEKENEEELLVKKNNLHDPSFKGYPVSKDLENGPCEDRHCTDLFCCLIFVLNIIGIVYVSMLSF